MRFCFLVSLYFAIAPVSFSAKADGRVDYLTQIKPILAARCYACHGALKQESGLRLDTAALAIKGGDSGAAIVPGDPVASLLIQRVTATDKSERMPAEGEPLKPAQVTALRRWIRQNAQAPSDEKPEQDPRNHWAFRPVVRPAVPQVANSEWVRNPIDAFISQKQEQFGLAPPVEAPREVLVRRLYLDLLGVVPTERELAEADADTNNGWYESLVGRFLNDPRYGERWARHWMDIWRYSDWWGLGEQLRYSQPHIWHWRDWIVESLNANTPYDEMVRLMLAADELHPNEPEKLRATGYLARNWTLFNRNVWMDETVEHVCKGFLGLTMNCAKCHDHKFDPIAQIDYYRMRAFFEPYQVRTDMVPGEPDLTRDGIPRVFDGPLDVPTYRFERGQESQPDKSKVITPGVPKFLSFREIEIQSVSLPNGAWQPERRPWVLESYIKACRKNLASAEATVSVARKKLELAESQLRNSHDVSAADKKSREFAVAAVADANAELDADEVAVVATRAELFSVERRAAAMRAAWTRDAEKGEANLANYERTMAVEAVKAERRATAAKARQIVADAELHLSRAAADAKGSAKNELTAAREAHKKAEQKAAAPIEPADHYTPLVGAKWSATRNMLSTKDDPAIEFPDHSTGRRKALAAWITDRRNPLTARVAVNHIWTRHLGTPLVPTVFDFGRKGTPPTHPELLDWLASEFIDSGWDMKHLHRLIVTSSTYRMSSAATSDANLAKDPDNLRLWHRPPIRLESEAVRDSILSLAGRLDLTRGGPPVLSAAQAKSNRRSLYFFHSNNDRDLFLTTFDEALVKECYRRDQSIVPQQALALCNSGLVLDAAKQVAERLSQPTATAGIPPDDREFVRKAFYVILGIRASGDEIGASLKALEAWRKLPNKPTGRSGDLARQHFVWALFNHNDFVTVR